MGIVTSVVVVFTVQDFGKYMHVEAISFVAVDA